MRQQKGGWMKVVPVPSTLVTRKKDYDHPPYDPSYGARHKTPAATQTRVEADREERGQ